MSINQNQLSAAVAGIVALGLSGGANALPDAPKAWEKCAGVAMAGRNDCGALDGSHNCASSSKVDRAPNEWVYVPEGTCAKIGGQVAKVVPAK